MIAAIGSVLLAAVIYKAFRISPRCKDDVNSTSTASSLVDIATPTTKYDVFLSFRGEDTRNNFASYLYKELCNASVHTFMDHKLQKGEQIAPVLLTTMEQSKIFVIIFSRDYASSTWCLDELVHILKCKDKYGRIVLPIFYNVGPSNIRKQNGSFGDGFAKLKRRFKHNQEKLQKWRDALDQAASLCGWDFNNTRSESKLVEEIVKDILSKLNRESSCDLEGLVGITHHIENIEKLLKEAPIVGIWGMGGAGKTTLAKVIFEKLKVQFDAFSFFENVKEQLVRIRMDEFQKNCLVELLKDEDINIYDIKSPFVRSRLQSKKMLLILDDVDNSIIAEDLTRIYNWLGEGSRIIITSRDMQVLKNASAFSAYHVSSLNFNEAFHLFCLKAFKRNEPSRGFMELSKSVVDYCKGNPLALVVLGCFLHGRGKEEWESSLDKINQDPPKDIVNVLKVSFDGLDDKQQNVFLDIAFFKKERVGISLNTIRQIHGSSADIDTIVLRERSLISFDDNYDYIKMHDLVREIGLQIARQQSFSDPKCHVRLWRPKDIDDYIFMSNKGEEAIRCLSVDMSKIKWKTLRPIKLQKMKNLIYLNVYMSDREKPIEIMNIFEDVDYFPKGLRFLSWERCPLSYVPLNMCAQNLVEFQMRGSHIQQLWKGDVHFPNLKEINVSCSRCLATLPDLSQAPNIERLYAYGCVSLDQIHSSTVLPKLSHLNLDDSGKMQIKIGGTMEGRNAGLVWVVNYLDLHKLSLNKVRMKVLACEGGRIMCGFGCKHMQVPLENREMAELKVGAQRLACLLPFVRRVEWSKGPIEFGDFNHHYTSHFYSCFKYGYDTVVVEVRRRGGERGEVGPWRREVVNLNDNDMGIEQEEVLMPQTNNTDDDMPLFTLPKAITRWTLLTEMMLKESEVIGNAGDSSIPQVSILRSLAHSHSQNNSTSPRSITPSSHSSIR